MLSAYRKLCVWDVFKSARMKSQIILNMLAIFKQSRTKGLGGSSKMSDRIIQWKKFDSLHKSL